MLGPTTWVPMFIVFINIAARPSVSHRFELCQHCRALTVEFLSTRLYVFS